MKTILGVTMYDTSETCDLLDVSRTTLSRLRNEGLIKSVPVSGGLYTSAENIEAYLRGETMAKKAKRVREKQHRY